MNIISSKINTQYNTTSKLNIFNNINFKGCLSIETTPNSIIRQGNTNILIHESYFFRDLKTLNFINQYINFLDKKNINIISAGCSEGFEIMSLKMLTDKDNKNKNINYLGFDPGEKSIQKANTFNFTILKPELESLKKYYNDSFLAYPIDSLSSISLEKIKLFFIFHKYFQFIKEKNINIHNIGPNTASLYKLKEKYRNNINFQTGNVLEMNKIVKKNSADVIFFKNALYHLTHDDNRIEKNRLDSFNILNKLVNEIDNALGNNGLFVIGSLKTSHTKRISDILYILLDIKNFKPIYFENNLPAIWQKQIIKKFNNFI